MTTVFYNEFYNENSQRNYPFDDQATMTSTEEYILRSDVIIDGMIYALDAVGVPYLSKIDMSEMCIQISDDNGVILTGDITDNNSVILYDIYDRQMGIITLGVARTILQGGKIYEFTTNATRFATTCWFPLSQIGVQGFLLEDGSLITGDVMFEGRNGMEIHSYYLSTAWYSGRNVLKFSAIGAIKTIDETDKTDCLGGGGSIKRIRLITTKGSKLIASDYEPGKGVIAITPRGFVQETLCKVKELPSPIPSKDICDPPDPPVPEPEQPDPSIIISDVTVCVDDGHLVIVTPSSPSVSNPVQIRVVEPAVPSVGWPLATNPFINNIKALAADQRFSAGGEISLMISIKGYNE